MLSVVTLPPFLKADLSLVRISTVVPACGCSSVPKLSGSFLCCGTWIGVIPSRRCLPSMVAVVFYCEVAAKTSYFSQVGPYFPARSSAVMLMW